MTLKSSDCIAMNYRNSLHSKSNFRFLLTALIWISPLGISMATAQQNSSAGIFVGIGFPEMFNGGITLQKNQLQSMVGLGYMQITGEELLTDETYTSTITTLSAEFLYHIAGKSSFSQRKPVYLRGGLIGGFSDENILFVDGRIGREFHFDKQVGLAMDIGVVYEAMNSSPETMSEFFDMTLFPAAGIRLFLDFKSE